jgi:glutamate-ammonia-ligase adenylyltransferase
MQSLPFDSLKKTFPELDQRVFDDFCLRLEERYFTVFDLDTHLKHLRGIQAVSQSTSVWVMSEMGSNDRVKTTVIAFDYPGVFSMITGILCSMGMDIRGGEAFTYAEAPPPPTKNFLRKSYFNQKEILRLRRPKIIDVFEGVLPQNDSFDVWSKELESRLKTVFDCLEEQQDDALMQAKEKINLWVSSWLWTFKHNNHPLLPLQIVTDNTNSAFTRLKIVTQDTPMFLYALSTALALRHISIIHFVIHTQDQRVEDELDVVGKDGKPILSEDEIAQLKLAIGLIKQFAYFLNQAPNPYDALSRFGQLMTSMMELPEKGEWIAFLSNPKALKDMARLFGASDFLWEDFVRIQYETLMPVFKHHVKDRQFFDEHTLEQRFIEVLDETLSYEEQKKVINEFKNKELFWIDLQSVLDKPSPEMLAKHLTLLAETLIKHAADRVEKHLQNRFGMPNVVLGIPAKWAIFGLGKLGGADLGYASDLELLFVYSDSGKTSGPETVPNEVYFDAFVQELSSYIEAKKDGIFSIDLRLRPYGKEGPLAVSLDQFCQYFGVGGPAFLYEKLALIRMRGICGHQEFCAQLERLRDIFVYESNVPSDEFWDLRKKQIQEKVPSGTLNAKYGAGALVDIEYAVQILQIRYGEVNRSLRTPFTAEAINTLEDVHVLTEDIRAQLVSSYHFFRKLINGLRLLRGSSQDLFLPELESEEFQHLARRTGYLPSKTLSAAQQLKLDFQTHSASIRNWIVDYFSQQWLPFQHGINVADVVLNAGVGPTVSHYVFKTLGFKNPPTAFLNTSIIAKKLQHSSACIRSLVLACDWLGQSSDPDRGLNNWERFIAQLDDPAAHIDLVLKQPARLKILMDVFSMSQYLSDLLIKYPEYLNWVTSHKSLSTTLKRGMLLKECDIVRKMYADNDEWRQQIRRFKHREMLRIAIRDLSMHVPVQTIVKELSLLAEVLIQTVLNRVYPQSGQDLCILAMGKLGGSELNYSSDIDLIAVCADNCSPYTFKDAIQQFTTEMMTFTSEGRVLRVDWTLRPFGRSGALVVTVSDFIRYYHQNASLWEMQALLKAKPVAGNWTIGWEALSGVFPPQLAQQFTPDHIFSSIKRLREKAIEIKTHNHSDMDIKNGRGGIRDIEFFVQALQLVHGQTYPDIVSRNTLAGLDALHRNGLIKEQEAQLLERYYILYRKIEHFLQILDDRQTHIIPNQDVYLHQITTCILGKHATVDELLDLLDTGFKEVHGVFSSL